MLLLYNHFGSHPHSGGQRSGRIDIPEEGWVWAQSAAEVNTSMGRAIFSTTSGMCRLVDR